MHRESYQLMGKMLKRWSNSAHVLDVGSFNVNGSLRPLAEERGWEYVGVDMREGPNVDIVSPSPHKLPFSESEFDIVLSASTLEHVERPWLLVPEMARVLKPGGMMVVYTHCSWPYHPFPQDYWRFFPETIRLLFDLSNCLTDYEIKMVNKDKDIYGLAWKTKCASKFYD